MKNQDSTGQVSGSSPMVFSPASTGRLLLEPCVMSKIKGLVEGGNSSCCSFFEYLERNLPTNDTVNGSLPYFWGDEEMIFHDISSNKF